MALSITVNGGGTFTASMEEGPVSFSASIGAVGPAGPTGPSGVVAASAPITYDSGTQTVGISATPTFTSVTAGTINLTTATFADATSQTTAFVGEARKEYLIARNNTGATIAKGKVVYISGATGNKPTMALAQADSESTSARTIGVTAEETAINGDGKVIISGAVENIDTSAFTAGQVVYLSATTAGGLVTTLPTQPNHGVVIGIVTRANPSVGAIEVFIQNYQELGELSDVLLVSKTNLDLLSWDTATSTWKNKSFSTLGLLTSATAASTYLSKAGNLSGLADLAVSRTNLGLGVDDAVAFGSIFKGTVAGLQYSIFPNDIWAGSYDGVSVTKTGISSSGVTFPDATVQATKGLIPASNLSDLASASTARTNLGLGTMAVETATDYLTKAGNLSGLASAATSRTNLDVYSKSESDALVPAASTTTAGKVELATDVEAATGTDTSRAVTPANLFFSDMTPDWQRLSFSFGAAQTGASAGTSSTDIGHRVFTGTASGAYALLRWGSNANYPTSRGKANGVVNFDKVVSFSGAFSSTQYVANSTIRVTFGKNNTDNNGNLARKGFGFRIAGTGAVELQVHDGTTLANVTSTFTPTAAQAFDAVVVSNAGNVKLYIDGSEVASSTGGPTGDSATTADFFQFEAETAAILGAQTILSVAIPKLYIGR